MTQTTTDPLVLDDASFDRVARLARDWAGLAILPQKRSLVQSRLARHARLMQAARFADYLDLVEANPGSDERQGFLEALTTNVTHFFREAHHFDILRESVLPPLVARAKAGGRVRIWSAGCSSGPEPYSIAMCLLDADPAAQSRNVRILATDLHLEALGAARDGEYPEGQFDGLPRGYAARFTTPAGSGMRRIVDDARALIAFRQLNLFGDWPMSGRFDAIFCRNVTIYFGPREQEQVWRRLTDRLAPGGYLFAGHSERLPPIVADHLTSVGATAFRANGDATP